MLDDKDQNNSSQYIKNIVMSQYLTFRICNYSFNIILLRKQTKAPIMNVKDSVKLNMPRFIDIRSINNSSKRLIVDKFKFGAR